MNNARPKLSTTHTLTHAHTHHTHTHTHTHTQDKTFGIKNKKGKKQQVFIKQVTNQVKFGGSSQQKREADEFQAKVGVA